MVKTFSFLSAILLLPALNASAAAPEVRRSLQLVACAAPNSRVAVYQKDGKQLASIDSMAQLNRFQGWGENDISVGPLKLARVQIPAAPQLKDVYVEASILLTADACATKTGVKLPYAPVIAELEDDDEEDDASAAPVYEAAKADEITKFSLDSSACCRFPLATRPKSFLSGIARFGAGRKKGRVHGGADLYGKRGQAVFSVAPGTVIRAPYMFKSGTLAIDVRHHGGFVVRYGEISGKSFGLRVGSVLKPGQQLGEMKFVPGAPAAMTHFELYRGTASGKLSQPGNNKYSRRGDILNPTPYLIKWEAKK